MSLRSLLRSEIPRPAIAHLVYTGQKAPANDHRTLESSALMIPTSRMIAKCLIRKHRDLPTPNSTEGGRWLRGKATPSFSTSASSGWTPLGRGSDGRFGLRRFRAKLTPTAFGTHRAFTHALPPSLRPPFCPFARVALFFLAAALVKEKTSRHRQKGKNMKLEEVNTRTKEAVDFLVAALESGHSEILTAYLGAMAKFHTYSFGNIMLIARQKPDATNVAGFVLGTRLAASSNGAKKESSFSPRWSEETQPRKKPPPGCR